MLHIWSGSNTIKAINWAVSSKLATLMSFLLNFHVNPFHRKIHQTILISNEKIRNYKNKKISIRNALRVVSIKLKRGFFFLFLWFWFFFFLSNFIFQHDTSFFLYKKKCHCTKPNDFFFLPFDDAVYIYFFNDAVEVYSYLATQNK